MHPEHPTKLASLTCYSQVQSPDPRNNADPWCTTGDLGDLHEGLNVFTRKSQAGFAEALIPAPTRHPKHPQTLKRMMGRAALVRCARSEAHNTRCTPRLKRSWHQKAPLRPDSGTNSAAAPLMDSHSSPTIFPRNWGTMDTRSFRGWKINFCSTNVLHRGHPSFRGWKSISNTMVPNGSKTVPEFVWFKTIANTAAYYVCTTTVDFPAVFLKADAPLPHQQHSGRSIATR